MRAVVVGIVLTAVAIALAAFLSAGCGSARTQGRSGPGQLAYSLSSQEGGIALVSDDGTGHRMLTPPRHYVSLPYASVGAPQWSPTGQQILFTAHNEQGTPTGTWTVNADGTGLRRFADDEYGQWSPDGRKVALWRDDGGLAIVTAEGKLRQTVRLRNPKYCCWEDLEWSPDGRFIAVDGDLETAEEDSLVVGVVDLRRGGFGVISRGLDESWPVWSPDGRWIALTRTRPGGGDYGRVDVWLVRPDGSERVRLIENQVIAQAYSQSALAWSPDGQALILELGRSLYRRPLADGRLELIAGPLPKRDVYFIGAEARGRSVWLSFSTNSGNVFFVLDSAGRLVRRIGPTAADSVSPDGKWFVRAEGAGLSLARTDGSGESELTPHSHETTEYALGWSAEGTQLVFSRLSSEGSGNFAVRVAGRREHRLPEGGSPQLAPDGKSLLVWSGGSAITVRALDDQSERVVARGRVRDPVWSPDGAAIAFVRDEGDPVGHDSFEVSDSLLYIVRRDGSGLRQLADSSDLCGDCYSELGTPAWTADGGSILVSEFEYRSSDGRGRLRRVDLDGGVQFTDVQGAGGALSAAVFAPDGSRAAFVSDKGIESVTLDDGKQTLLGPGPFNYDVEVGEEPWGAWSPDSTKLAYIRGGLHVVDRDGSDERTVSRPGETVRSFAWRPSALSSEG